MQLGCTYILVVGILPKMFSRYRYITAMNHAVRRNYRKGKGS